MLTHNQLTALLGLAVVSWGCALFVLGVPVNWEYTKPFALTVSVLSAACLVFDRWLWRLRLLQGWFVNEPDIQGTWKVQIASDWVDPATEKKISPIEGIMVIRQTFSLLSARLFTAESSSFLQAHKLVRQNDGVFQLFGVYQNNPKVELRGQRSEIHYGALFLELRGDPPLSLKGHYWTDRGTRGSMDLLDRSPKILTSYEEGKALFGLSAKPKGRR